MQGIVILVLLAALFAPCIVLAQTESSRHPYFTNKHSISVGATRQTADSEVRSSVPYLPELSLSLDDLGVDKRDNSWMAEYRWRFKPKWGLVVAGYQFDNDGSLEVSKDFNFDGVEFEAGARVDTDLKVGTYIVDLMYQVYQSEKVEMMLGGGLHMINFDMKVKSSVFTDERDFTIQQGASDLLVPLPNIRFQGFYAITDKWALGLTAGWLSASYEDYDGSFTYAHLRTVYRFFPHVSASLGYQFNSIDLTYDQSRGRESQLDIKFDGPTIQLTYSF